MTKDRAYVRVTLSPASLIGDGTTFEAEGLDVGKTCDAFEVILFREMQAWFPGTDVIIEWYLMPLCTRIDVGPDWGEYLVRSVRTHVEEIMTAVLEGRHGSWRVDAASVTTAGGTKR